jgi:hypothetical protein
MYGEKFMEQKIDGNRIMRIFEYKDFKYNFLELIQDLNDNITDDWEVLNDKEIYMNRMEEFDNFFVDTVLEWIRELITDKKIDGEKPEDYFWLEKWIEPLKEAEGFVIHIIEKKDMNKEVSFIDGKELKKNIKETNGCTQ